MNEANAAQVPVLHIGIDLGTTNSTAAVFDGKDLTVVRNGEGSLLTPSVVRIDKAGRVLVGSRARRFLYSDPDNTKSEFKRLMGTAHEIGFPASGLRKRPEELSAEILKTLRQDIAEQLGCLPVQAVVSVPAMFELQQTAAVAEAARLAGFERIELIQEPVAAAIAAGWNTQDTQGAWMVFDLGGGTLDVSLLETRDGLLRVVGHDGDNFLGGRDLDLALVQVIIGRLAQQGVHIDRANPQHAGALQKLKVAAEDAKIELTRALEAQITLSDLKLDGEDIEVDLVVTRAEYENAIEPLVARALAVCRRLMTATGVDSGGLKRMVLVGGPTVTPMLRERIRVGLSVALAEGLDPMTLVAKGAALFAATVKLDARPTPAPQSNLKGARVWLQHPAVTSDLSPFVVGKMLDPATGVCAVTIGRDDNLWQSESVPVEADGTFAVMVSLVSRQTSIFHLSGVDAQARAIALQPASFSIAHGLTIGETPLSRSIGIALADNRVQTYFHRGSPLPMRRTFMLRTVETVSAQTPGHALKAPIVQGEFNLASLCRLVGTLEIRSEDLTAPLPVGTEVDLMLELDRGGQLRASARIESIHQTFDDVVMLVTPQVSAESLDAAFSALRNRAVDLSRSAFQERSGKTATRVSDALKALEEVTPVILAGRGGDLDALEQARRRLSDVDALLAEVEADMAWPALREQVDSAVGRWIGWVGEFGSSEERNSFGAATQAARAALVGKDPGEVARQLGLMRQLGAVAYHRHPDAWQWEFDHAAARVGDSTDIRRATTLVAAGREALRQRDVERLKLVVRELWQLDPVDREDQVRGFGSGLRAQ